MTDFFMCFSCCANPPAENTKKRRQITRAMIGLPTDFRHTGHIGANEVTSEDHSQEHLNAIQNQMSSKGGYEHVTPVDVKMEVMDPIDVKLEHIDIQKRES